MIHFVVPGAQAFAMRDYLAAHPPPAGRDVRIVPYETLPDRATLPRGTWILAALDQLGPARLRHAAIVRDALAAAGCDVLNDPRRTLHRLALLTALRASGRNAFAAVPAAAADLGALRYPVFVRRARAHDGPQSPLLRTPAEVRSAIGRLVMGGAPVDDVLVVEFCDTADAHGRYRKFAAFVVGDRVVPRSLAYGPGWMLKHRATEYTEASVREELDYVRDDPHGRELAEIFALAGVRYGRIDYALLDGRVQTWEINLNPTIGRGLRASRGVVPPALEPMRDEMKATFYARFGRALEAVDGAADGPEVRVDVPPAVAAAARREPMGARRGRGEILLDRLPARARPLLRSLAARALPAVGRMARIARGGRP